MTKLTVKVIVAMLGIGSTAALVSGAPAHSDQMQVRVVGFAMPMATAEKSTCRGP